MDRIINYKKLILDATQRINPHILKTPVKTSSILNKKTGCNLFFKCENLQKTKSFKIRGASNAIFSLTPDEKANGVVAHSSGNFAQAVALAAREANITAYIVMPSNASKTKISGVLKYGGNITFSDSNSRAREEKAAQIAKDTGAYFLHPSNNLEVIIGQGTAACEFLEEIDDLDVIITPVGGGGLIAGTALSVRYFGKSDMLTIGGEPFEVDDAYRSLKSRKIEFNQTTNTIADGLKTSLGHINFPIIQEHVDSIIRVGEDEIIEAMKLIYNYLEIIIEPSSAVALAALLRDKLYFQGQNIGIILSGGNIDPKRMKEFL